MTAVNFTTPVGRLVQGSLYEPNEKDADGNIRVYKSGPKTGQPRPEFFVALAIPKIPGQHWASSEWGAVLWQVGHTFKPQASQMQKFAWKIRDGDSALVDQKGRAPKDREGFPGCWILSFSSGFEPKCYTIINQPVGGNGKPEPLLLQQPDAINLGDYVQINANCDSNDSEQQPGIYLNLSMVCLCGYGQRIVIGPDVASAGFGGSPLPAGASMQPPAGFTAPPSPAAPAIPAVPGTGIPSAPTASIPAPPGTAPSTIAPPPPPGGTPNPAFIAAPPVPGAAGAPPAPQAGPQMLPAAGGVPYSDFIAKGWTDVLLRQHGMMA